MVLKEKVLVEIEIGELCLRDVISFKIFYESPELLLFS